MNAVISPQQSFVFHSHDPGRSPREEAQPILTAKRITSSGLIFEFSVLLQKCGRADDAKRHTLEALYTLLLEDARLIVCVLWGRRLPPCGLELRRSVHTLCSVTRDNTALFYRRKKNWE